MRKIACTFICLAIVVEIAITAISIYCAYNVRKSDLAPGTITVTTSDGNIWSFNADGCHVVFDTNGTLENITDDVITAIYFG